MIDFFTGRTIEDLEKSIDVFVKVCRERLIYFKREPMPTYEEGIYYLKVEYDCRNHNARW